MTSHCWTQQGWRKMPQSNINNGDSVCHIIVLMDDDVVEWDDDWPPPMGRKFTQGVSRFYQLFYFQSSICYHCWWNAGSCLLLKMADNSKIATSVSMSEYVIYVVWLLVQSHFLSDTNSIRISPTKIWDNWIFFLGKTFLSDFFNYHSQEVSALVAHSWILNHCLGSSM